MKDCKECKGTGAVGSLNFNERGFEVRGHEPCACLRDRLAKLERVAKTASALLSHGKWSNILILNLSTAIAALEEPK